MLTTINDLDAFHEFAVAKLREGAAKPLTELVAQWEANRPTQHSDQEHQVDSETHSNNNTIGLPAWCNVYDGLSDEEIADLESVILQRADLSRPTT